MLAVSGGVGLPHEPPLGTNSARGGGLESYPKYSTVVRAVL